MSVEKENRSRLTEKKKTKFPRKSQDPACGSVRSVEELNCVKRQNGNRRRGKKLLTGAPDKGGPDGKKLIILVFR